MSGALRTIDKQHPYVQEMGNIGLYFSSMARVGFHQINQTYHFLPILESTFSLFSIIRMDEKLDAK